MERQLRAGEPAPDFILSADGGGAITRADYAGHKLVVFFFPKSDTPGCTREAQDFSALADAFAQVQTKVLGVSADPVAKQAAFKAKRGLAIAFGSDEARRMLEDFGVWVEKSMYGRRYMGVERATFLIGADGRIARIWRNVKVPGHAAEVLEAAATAA